MERLRFTSGELAGRPNVDPNKLARVDWSNSIKHSEGSCSNKLANAQFCDRAIAELVALRGNVSNEVFVVHDSKSLQRAHNSV